MKLNECIELVRNTMLPYQWEALNDRVPGAEPSYVIRNFQLACKPERAEGERFQGTMWQDSDLYKWLEAVAYALGERPDDKLYRAARAGIDLIIKAQQPDGYVNTYFTLGEPAHRFDNLEQAHELYCAGHLIEAAVAWARATGETGFLGVARRLADLLDRTIGPEDGKLHGYPGHPEVELALIKLHLLTGEERYLKLAGYMVNQRGQAPNFFLMQRDARGYRNDWGEFMEMNYFQAHMPLKQQQHATGHCVRATYLYTAAADLARLLPDDELRQTCLRLWKDVTARQMYLTGAIGSSPIWESFTVPYHLPLDRAYTETCAAVGLVFFARSMIELEPSNPEYGAVIERALYNAVLSGFSGDGMRFFYTNPQQAYSDVSGCVRGQGDPVLAHERMERQRWHGCACCPPNAARLVASLSQYETSWDAARDTLRIQLIVPGERSAAGEFGRIAWTCDTEYPWDGKIALTIREVDLKRPIDIAVRVPDWAEGGARFTLPDGAGTIEEPGFLRIRHDWRPGDAITLDWPMDIRRVHADARVRDTVGKVAIARGPLVYCAEQIDVDAPICDIFLSRADIDSLRAERTEYGVCLRGGAWLAGSAGDGLYTTAQPTWTRVPFVATPYFEWGNRGKTDMTIWFGAIPELPGVPR